MSRPACPACKSDNVHRSRRSGWERLLGVGGVRPYRCHACDHRFFGRIDPAEDSNAEAFNGRVRTALLGAGILIVGGVAGSMVYSCTAGQPAVQRPAPVAQPAAPAAPALAKPAAVKPAPEPTPPVPKAKGEVAFEVQLGAFRGAASAEELEARAREAGLAVVVRRPGRGTRTRLFRVMLSEGFVKQREAEKVADAIRKKHAIKAIVMRVEG